jgi:hypothetical protein
MPQAFMPPNGLHKFLSSQTDQFRERSGGQVPHAESEEFGTMAAFCRERPFPTGELGSDSMWFHLPTWKVPDWLLLQSDLGYGGASRFNLFELLASFGVPQAEQAAYARPRWHREDIERRGLRPYSETTKYVAQGRGGMGQWYAERDTWLDILRDWHGPNPYLRQGRLAAKVLLPEIRVGQRLIVDAGDPSDSEQFYVEGVSGNWRAPTQTAGASGMTTFTVTRGYVGSDSQLLASTEKMTDVYKRLF